MNQVKKIVVMMFVVGIMQSMNANPEMPKLKKQLAGAIDTFQIDFLEPALAWEKSSAKTAMYLILGCCSRDEANRLSSEKHMQKLDTTLTNFRLRLFYDVQDGELFEMAKTLKWIPNNRYADQANYQKITDICSQIVADHQKK